MLFQLVPFSRRFCMDAATRQISQAYWWLLILRGVVALLFGIMAIISVEFTLLFLVYLFGVCLARWYHGYHRIAAGAEILFSLVDSIPDRNCGYRGWCAELHPSRECGSVDFLSYCCVAHHCWLFWS